MKLIQSVLILAFTCSASHAFGVAPPNQHQSQSASVSTSSTTTQLNESKLGNFLEQPFKHLGSLVLSSAIILNTAGVMSVAPSPAMAADSTVVGSLKGSGLVFKDTLNVERFEDPKVKGVVLYVSNFDRPVTEKLSGNFFNDPSQSSEFIMEMMGVSGVIIHMSYFCPMILHHAHIICMPSLSSEFIRLTQLCYFIFVYLCAFSFTDLFMMSRCGLRKDGQGRDCQQHRQRPGR